MSLREHLSRRAGWWLLATAIIVLILLWDWNWFRPLVERQLSSRLQRPVTLQHFDLHPGRSSTVELQGLRVGNPATFKPDAPAALQLAGLSIQLDTLALFKQRVSIQKLTLTQANAALQKMGDGSSNYTLPASNGTSSAWVVEILQLAISDSQFRWQDAGSQSDIHGKLATKAGQDGEDTVVASAEGRYQGQPLQARFRGGSILALRDPAKPYAVDLGLDSGNTRITLKGSVLDPMHMAGAKLLLTLKGDDLATLYPLIPIALPTTPAYSLSGALDYSAGAIRFKDFKGVVGSSDLNGTASVRLAKPRPVLEAELNSRQILLADLAGLIGGTPGKAGAANDTDKLAAERAANAANPRLLPGKHIDLPRIRAADIHVHYVGEHIQGDKMPLDDLELKLDIVDGNIKVSPVKFGVGEGRIEVFASLDNDGKQPQLDVLANLKRLDVSQLLTALGNAYKGDGRIGGQVKLKTHGHSVAEWLGNGNGNTQLFMSGGNFSAVLLDLAGLDFGNALISGLGIPSRTNVRCLVADMPLENGVFKAKTVVLDTGNANLLVEGSANMADETLDLRAHTEPKRLNIGRLRAPINISGTLKNPRVLPDLTQLGLRTGAAVVLGTLLTPAAALLPTLQLGLGEDHDCAALMQSASAQKAARNAQAK